MCRLAPLLLASRLALASSLADPGCEDTPRITGLIDGNSPENLGLPKVAQIYFPTAVAPDEDNYKVTYEPDAHEHRDYLTMPGTLHAGATLALDDLSKRFKDQGGFIYVTAHRESFKAYMGFWPDFVDSRFYPAGVGSVVLSAGKDPKPIDKYGLSDASADLRAKWNFTKGSASRIFGTCPNPEGDIESWVITKGTAKDHGTMKGVQFVKFQSCESFPCADFARFKDRSCTTRTCGRKDHCHCCDDKTSTCASKESPPSSSPAEPVVIVHDTFELTMKVLGLDYSLLMAAADLKSLFEQAMKGAIAHNRPFGPEVVTLQLASGSVVVGASVEPPAGTLSKSFCDLHSSTQALAEDATEKVNGIPNIANAGTGHAIQVVIQHVQSDKVNHGQCKADCSGVACPVGYIIRASPSKISCAGSVCNDSDLKTCCQQVTTPPPAHAVQPGIGNTENSMPASIQGTTDWQKGKVSFVSSLFKMRLSVGPMTASMAPLLMAISAVSALVAIAKAAHRQRCPPANGEAHLPTTLIPEEQLPINDAAHDQVQ